MDLKQVDVLDFLTALGVRNVMDEGEEARFSCPFPGHRHGDENASAYMNTETTAYFCHGCKRKGNAIHFLSELEGISPLLAARYIRERYNQGFIDPDTHGGLSGELEQLFQAKDDPKVHTNQPIQYELEDLPVEAKDYLSRRGFIDETINSWGLGYDRISNRIAIPVCDEHSSLVGFKGRAFHVGHNPKYLVLGDTPRMAKGYGFNTMEKSLVVYGIDRATEHEAPLVLAEGELNVLALYQAGIPNPCAINGSALSKRQMEIILRASGGSGIVLFLDSDEAGLAGTLACIEAFEPHMPVRVVEDHEKDPADLTSEECVRLVSEAKSTTELLLPRN